MATDSMSGDIGGVSSAVVSGALRRRWYAVVLGVLLGLGVAGAYTLTRPVQYRSAASVLVTPVGPAAEFPDRSDAVDLDTELQLVRSQSVAGAARTLLASPISPELLARRVEVAFPANTRVMEVSFVAPTATAAQQGAHAFAQGYLEVRSADAKTSLSRKVDALEAEVTELEERLGTVAEQIATLPANTTGAVVANAQRAILINQISTIEAKASPLRAAPTSAGVIVDDAFLPARPAGPAVPMNLGGGGLLGLLFGLAAALAVDRLDGRLRGADDLERRLGLPVLAHVPGGRKVPVSIAPMASAAGRAISQLRDLLVADPGPGSRVIVVRGVSSGAGGGFLAANLACALARSDYDVLLVAAVDKSPCAALLGVTPEGAKRLAGSTAGLPRYQTSLPGLRVCIPAPGVDGGLDWVESDAFARLVAGATSGRGVVVIQAPAMSAGAPTQPAVLLGVSTVLVIEARRTTCKQASFAYRALERTGPGVQGLVVVPRLSRHVTGALAAPETEAEPGSRAGSPPDRLASTSALQKARKP